jgi:hypothetical protein
MRGIGGSSAPLMFSPSAVPGGTYKLMESSEGVSCCDYTGTQVTVPPSVPSGADVNIFCGMVVPTVAYTGTATCVLTFVVPSGASFVPQVDVPATDNNLPALPEGTVVTCSGTAGSTCILDTGTTGVLVCNTTLVLSVDCH